MAPERTCIGCRRKAAPHELVRVVRVADGSLAVGRSLPGRGAWLCAGSQQCLELAIKRKAFSRALRADVDGAAMASLRASLADRARMVD